MDVAIEQAVAEATHNNITGKAVTPFLLQKLVELTGGRSLTANIALAENNAKLGAAIAVAYSRRGAASSNA
jgi:pseudouridylate synthase